jgi:hypothetical protein
MAEKSKKSQTLSEAKDLFSPAAEKNRSFASLRMTKQKSAAKTTEDALNTFSKDFLRALCVSAVKGFQLAYIPITRSIALRQTAQNVLCRVNIMQSTSER